MCAENKGNLALNIFLNYAFINSRLQPEIFWWKQGRLMSFERQSVKHISEASIC